MGYGLILIDKNTDEIKYKEQQKSSFSVGRVDGNEVVVDNSTVSRKHAIFFRLGKDWVVSDPGSTNGTFLNDKRLEKEVHYLVRAGDQISFGECDFIINEENAERRTPILYVFNGHKYLGEFPISETTDFSFGGNNATIESSDPSITEVIFIIRQDENGLLLSCKHPTHLPSKNDLLVSGRVSLNDQDRIKIENLIFLVSVRDSEGVNKTIDNITSKFQTPANVAQRNKTGTDVELPSYLQSRFGEEGWEDPLERKRRSSSTVFSLDQLSDQDERERERASSTLRSRAELVGVQRFTSPSLEMVKEQEERQKKKLALIGTLTIVALLVMSFILLSMYKPILV